MMPPIPHASGDVSLTNPPPTGTRRLAGFPLRLQEYAAETLTNRQFASFDLSRWDRCFLPPQLGALLDEPPVEFEEFIEDDNRTAILPTPVVTMDGQPFFLSVKGVGSAIDPFSHRRLDATMAAELTQNPEVRARLRRPGIESGGGIITGELWLRGSPYGGQGLPHAQAALEVSERADLTSLGGFRIAPVAKIAFLPPPLEERLRSIHWYRAYPGRMVQEIRLVPSNTRIYFHGRDTVGTNVGAVFDHFCVDAPAKADRFETNFVRSGIALLTLFARTLIVDPERDRYAGLDFQDVWLDKDAVLAPDGTAYFVDLEGIAPVRVERSEVREKFEDQIFRSLYEFMFAYEQIEGERVLRFGRSGSRKERFASVVEAALSGDPFVRIRRTHRAVLLEVRPRFDIEELSFDFSLVDL